ncbi:MAG TPA: DUF1501 domain-containing protein [Verrucomicrobiales bacterium]|nr:DUF1501 domain-containing protein [Verrucomicrobiales bacterium]
MKCNYSCKSEAHLVARRQFLGGSLATGAGLALGGLGMFTHPATARELARGQKRMLVVRMAGGLSQLESWDPKPGTATGGPFRAIPTSVPGIHLSELLPWTAKQMHHLALIRGINTNENDHGKGDYMMITGRRQTPAADYPEIGAVVARALDLEGSSALPGHIKIVPGGGGGRSADSAYLGPRYASVVLGNGNPPQHTERPESLTEDVFQCRSELRQSVDDRFALRRRTAETEAYTQSFEQARELMAEREIFDLEREPEKDRERYGTHDFGRHCLLARRLLENGITCVQVTHSNYDTHNENFTFHFEQLGEFDRPFATLVSDLAERGLLESTLVVVLSEFGRTPHINHLYGRDHWGTSWSICLGGAGIQPGAVIGATSADGTEVKERQVDAGHLFHTYLAALGLKSTGHFTIDGRKVPMADPAFEPISELLV